MKILMLGWELPPHNSGGLGVACYQMCKALSASGAAIDFILPYEAEHNISFMNVIAAVPISRDTDSPPDHGAYDGHAFLNENGELEYMSLNQQHALFESGVENIATSTEYDVIHAHDWLTFRAGMKAKAISGKPLIVHVHATEYDRAGGKNGNPLVEEIEYLGMQMADKIIAVSQLTKDIIIKRYKIPAEKIEVVHNAIDLSVYESLEAENSYRYLKQMRAAGYKVVLNFGRLTVQKGLDNLLRAMQQVILRSPKTFLVIMGSGEQLDELIQLAADLRIADKVMFVEFQRGKRWRDIFEVSDLFVLPSVSEPFGLTPLEAVGMGVPALISHQSGAAEIMHHALKVDFWDVQDMADQITSVVQNDALQQELLKNSSEELTAITWHRTADKIHTIYKEHRQEVTV